MKTTFSTNYYVGRLPHSGKWGRKEGDLFVGKYKQGVSTSGEKIDAIQINSYVLFTFKEFGAVIGTGILASATIFAKGILGL